MKFRRKPIVIEAELWDGSETQRHRLNTWIVGNDFCWSSDDAPCLLVKETGLKFYLRAAVGDWIIKDVTGEFRPCKPDIFEATYELVKESGETS